MYLLNLHSREVRKLVKMLKLVHNEYIKVMKKLSTKIIFVLIALFVIGLIGLSKFAQNTIEKDMVNYYSGSSDYSYEIGQAKEMKYEGYELDVEKYSFLTDNGITPDSWKYEAASDLFSHEENETKYDMSDAERSKLEKMIKDGDWKSYCQYKIDVLKAAGMSEAYYWLYDYCLKNEIALPESYSDSIEYPYNTVSQASEQRISIAGFDEMGDISEEVAVEKAAAEEKLKLLNYQLENDIEVNISECSNIFVTDYINFWSVFGTSASLVSVIGMLLIIVAGGTVASEFSNGTVKFLLINPVKRWKILMSKYIMTITLGFLMMAFMYILSAILSMLFFGASLADIPYIKIENGTITEMNGFLFILRKYLFKSVNVIVMSTLAFAISSLVRSSSLAIGVSIFAMLSGSTIVQLMKMAFNLDWARYLIFANTDIESIIEGTSMFSHHSLPFALGVIAVHMLVFLLTAWDGFTRREV